MKSTEVYSLLKSELAALFKSAGFKRTKGLLGWSRTYGDAHTVVWCQVSQDGWDAYAGSKFTVELQRSPEPLIGGWNARRQRFAGFLSKEEREEVRAIQNSVIAGLPRPPANHPVLHISEEVAEWYLKQFKAVSGPYLEGHDIWFRCASPEQVIRWARFIHDKIPDWINVAEGWPKAGNALPPSR